MASDSVKTDLQLITDAIGAHGIFFKKALRGKLASIAGIRILGEEYPVRYLEGASIDLLVEFKAAHTDFVIPIECKRALVSAKTWIFFRDTEKEVKFLYSFTGADLSVSKSSQLRIESDICVEGIEIDRAKLRNGSKGPYAAASSDNIWKAAFQACKGGLGFLQTEIQARKTNTAGWQSNFCVFLLVVTTAPLQVAELPGESLDLENGLYLGDLILKDVPWLILHYPFTPTASFGTSHLQVNIPGYSDPVQRGLHSKEGVMIVNAQHIERFLQLLKQQ